MNNSRFAVFVTIITMVWGVLLGYVTWRLFHLLPASLQYPAVISSLIAWISHPLAFSSRLWPDRPWKQPTTQLSYAIFGISAVFAVSFMGKDITLGLLALVIQPEWYHTLDLGATILLIIVALVVGVVGFWQALQLAKVKRLTVHIPQLPAEWAGLRIAHITDIHIGSTSDRSVMQQIVDRVNQLQPDIVAITGDLVDGSVQDLQHHVAPIFSLQATLGSYFCTGNHDYYSGAEQWSRYLQQGGIEVLSNRHVIHQRQQTPLVVAGVRDLKAHQIIRHHRCDPVEALRDAPREGIRLLLAHQPKSIKLMQDETVDLVLAGHTHGGQFFPFSVLIHLVQPWNAGLYQTKYGQLYVSRGTTHWGPPIRFGSQHEITLLELQPAPA